MLMLYLVDREFISNVFILQTFSVTQSIVSYCSILINKFIYHSISRLSFLKVTLILTSLVRETAGRLTLVSDSWIVANVLLGQSIIMKKYRYDFFTGILKN